MTKDEALKLALEALEDLGMKHYESTGEVLYKETFTAIKEALAQPEPNYKKALEVWLDKTEWVQETVKPHELGMHRADVLKQRIEATLAQLEQDLVEWGVDWGPDGNSVSIIKRLADGGIEVVGWEYAPHPPQRTWVNATTWRGLTDDEILSISADCASSHQHMDIHFARAIEAKLKAKNSL